MITKILPNRSFCNNFFKFSNICAGRLFSDETEEKTLLTISGVVSDASSGSPIAGANVVVEGGEIGSAADEDGAYTISDVEVGSSINVSAIGYEDLTLFADTETLNFELTPSVVEMTELEVLASRASKKLLLHTPIFPKKILH